MIDPLDTSRHTQKILLEPPPAPTKGTASNPARSQSSTGICACTCACFAKIFSSQQKDTAIDGASSTTGSEMGFECQPIPPIQNLTPPILESAAANANSADAAILTNAGKVAALPAPWQSLIFPPPVQSASGDYPKPGLIRSRLLHAASIADRFLAKRSQERLDTCLNQIPTGSLLLTATKRSKTEPSQPEPFSLRMEKLAFEKTISSYAQERKITFLLHAAQVLYEAQLEGKMDLYWHVRILGEALHEISLQCAPQEKPLIHFYLALTQRGYYNPIDSKRVFDLFLQSSQSTILSPENRILAKFYLTQLSEQNHAMNPKEAALLLQEVMTSQEAPAGIRDRAAFFLAVIWLEEKHGLFDDKTASLLFTQVKNSENIPKKLCAEAGYCLSIIHLEGFTIHLDNAEAYKYLEEYFTITNDVEAKFYMAYMNYTGKVGTLDKEQIFSFFKEVYNRKRESWQEFAKIEALQRIAGYYMACIHLEGNGSLKNDEEACMYLFSAIKCDTISLKDKILAGYRLGLAHIEGRVSFVNPDNIRHYFMQALVSEYTTPEQKLVAQYGIDIMRGMFHQPTYQAFSSLRNVIDSHLLGARYEMHAKYELVNLYLHPENECLIEAHGLTDPSCIALLQEIRRSPYLSKEIQLHAKFLLAEMFFCDRAPESKIGEQEALQTFKDIKTFTQSLSNDWVSLSIDPPASPTLPISSMFFSLQECMKVDIPQLLIQAHEWHLSILCETTPDSFEKTRELGRTLEVASYDASQKFDVSPQMTLSLNFYRAIVKFNGDSSMSDREAFLSLLAMQGTPSADPKDAAIAGYYMVLADMNKTESIAWMNNLDAYLFLKRAIQCEGVPESVKVMAQYMAARLWLQGRNPRMGKEEAFRLFVQTGESFIIPQHHRIAAKAAAAEMALDDETLPMDKELIFQALKIMTLSPISTPATYRAKVYLSYMRLHHPVLGQADQGLISQDLLIHSLQQELCQREEKHPLIQRRYFNHHRVAYYLICYLHFRGSQPLVSSYNEGAGFSWVFDFESRDIPFKFKIYAKYEHACLYINKKIGGALQARNCFKEALSSGFLSPEQTAIAEQGIAQIDIDQQRQLSVSRLC